MSRSKRHAPVTGWTTARSEKDDKTLQHRRWRAVVREALAHERWDRASYDVPQSRWYWDKDGKQRWPAWAWGERPWDLWSK